MREGYILMGKSRVEAFEIAGHGIVVEMVYHKALPSRGCTFHFLARLFHHRILVGIEYNLVGGIGFGHEGSAKRPSRACGHIGLNAQCGSSGLHILQHTHPTWRKIGNVVSIIPFHPIDGCDFHTANACLGVFGQIIVQACGIDRTAQPPPAGVGLRFLRNGNPLLGKGTHTEKKNKGKGQKCFRQIRRGSQILHLDVSC